MALLDEARMSVRMAGTMTDPEIQGLIDAAIADMRRCGVREELLAEPEGLAKNAVLMFCKALYGYDNSEKEFFYKAYHTAVTSLMNSTANECAS